VADQVTRGAARLAALIALPIAVVAGLIAFWTLGGFGHGTPAVSPSGSPAPQSSAPVAMPAPTLTGRPATVCLALLSQLPQAVRDRPRRPVAAGPEQNAAYGDPAITLACGGATPSVAPDATVYRLSGVCWYADQAANATTWTTLDREVPITVTVPARYDSPGQWVAEFSAPIVTAVPSVTSAVSGCRS
jgi:hypothetical protein